MFKRVSSDVTSLTREEAIALLLQRERMMPPLRFRYYTYLQSVFVLALLLALTVSLIDPSWTVTRKYIWDLTRTDQAVQLGIWLRDFLTTIRSMF